MFASEFDMIVSIALIVFTLGFVLEVHYGPAVCDYLRSIIRK